MMQLRLKPSSLFRNRQSFLGLGSVHHASYTHSFPHPVVTDNTRRFPDLTHCSTRTTRRTRLCTATTHTMQGHQAYHQGIAEAKKKAKSEARTKPERMKNQFKARRLLWLSMMRPRAVARSAAPFRRPSSNTASPCTRSTSGRAAPSPSPPRSTTRCGAKRECDPMFVKIQLFYKTSQGLQTKFMLLLISGPALLQPVGR